MVCIQLNKEVISVQLIIFVNSRIYDFMHYGSILCIGS